MLDQFGTFFGMRTTISSYVFLFTLASTRCPSPNKSLSVVAIILGCLDDFSLLVYGFGNIAHYSAF